MSQGTAVVQVVPHTRGQGWPTVSTLRWVQAVVPSELQNLGPATVPLWRVFTPAEELSRRSDHPFRHPVLTFCLYVPSSGGLISPRCCVKHHRWGGFQRQLLSQLGEPRCGQGGPRPSREGGSAQASALLVSGSPWLVDAHPSEPRSPRVASFRLSTPSSLRACLFLCSNLTFLHRKFID